MDECFLLQLKKLYKDYLNDINSIHREVKQHEEDITRLKTELVEYELALKTIERHIRTEEDRDDGIKTNK